MELTETEFVKAVEYLIIGVEEEVSKHGDEQQCCVACRMLSLLWSLMSVNTRWQFSFYMHWCASSLDYFALFLEFPPRDLTVLAAGRKW